eukprot:m.78815 g.78815  ORF g.78815 m.78815 type:complete len:504 (+) comp12548_c0_seq4:377-1888(+)
MAVRLKLPATVRKVLRDAVVNSTKEQGTAAVDTVVQGWVKSIRRMKRVSFVTVSDGTSADVLQVVAKPNQVSEVTIGSAIRIQGNVQPSPAAGQAVEMHADTVDVIGPCDAGTYPIQRNKNPTPEFLRTLPHLRGRTTVASATARIRSSLVHATHRVMEAAEFLHLHTPIITGNDCEGAGETFQIAGGSSFFSAPRLEPDVLDLTDLTKPNFGKSGNALSQAEGQGECSEQQQEYHLTVSGQLHAETYACGVHPRIYTFGPTFRAENSNTPRHLAEFYMLEPEIAFAGLSECISLQQYFIQSVLQDISNRCSDDLQTVWERFPEGESTFRLLAADSDFVTMTYSDAIKELQAHQTAAQSFREDPIWGCNLGLEHESFLASKVVNGPVFVTDYPEAIKAFYMRQNDSGMFPEGDTVAATDLLIPGIGELCGGSAREERLDLLTAKLKEVGQEDKLGWYLDLRRFGSVPHAGFGLGFERLLMAITGIPNIRDVIPFPRHPGTVLL